MCLNRLWIIALLMTTVVFDDSVVVECRHRKKIGHLQTKSHGVKGTVYILNKGQILIQQFTFIGKGLFYQLSLFKVKT
jgi:hypothetical protein